MSATAHAPTQPWARVHRAAITIVVLSLAIAACVGLLVAGRLSGTQAPGPPAGSVSQVDQQPTTVGCEAARQWGRC